MTRTPEIIEYRYESFGGILHLQTPAALIYVDKDYMLSLGYSPSPLWDVNRNVLTAPTEVHLAVTQHCSKGCSHCYMDSCDLSGKRDADGVVEGEMGPDGLIEAIDVMADRRVFHVALGGGESFEMPWLMDVVRHARERGMVPNITTNGHYIDETNVADCRMFGQINVSLNEVGPFFSTPGARAHFERVDRTLTLLRKAGIGAGINCIVTRGNFESLEQIVRYAKEKKVREIEFLRYKPAGRAGAVYYENALTPDQAVEFFPRVASLMKRHRVTLKLDCSFTPLICYQDPGPEKMDFFAVLGCVGGDMLMGGRADGCVAPCSFAPWENRDIRQLASFWDREDTFADYRLWHRTAPEPCNRCKYMEVCRGGCHAISEFVAGDPSLPDPECPHVREHRPVVN